MRYAVLDGTDIWSGALDQSDPDRREHKHATQIAPCVPDRKSKWDGSSRVKECSDDIAGCTDQDAPHRTTWDVRQIRDCAKAYRAKAEVGRG